ncbi:hypothetical protein MPH_09947 [Macrophomina phaseolina MS6]|uniref:Uncharacterized protein n=1 Tax=Macrophomina phaseolina (strain MS6) TaxID=1126212 RepID=K2S7W4_MACPH|nr:hypothetical protein MPH_09947 [Macrophomina phaseolina MS6]
METNYARSASPSTFTLSKGRNNRLSILSTRSSLLADRTASPPPSYDGLAGPPAGTTLQISPGQPDRDVSAALDTHLPLTISNKGWSEVESVSKQFLLENLPGWIAALPDPAIRDGPKASSLLSTAAPAAQQKQLSQLIKAGVRKSRKGLVLRLLRRTPDADEIADLRLDAPQYADEQAAQKQGGAPAELEAIPAHVRRLPGIHEAPAEPPVYELPTTVALTPRRRGEQDEAAAGDGVARQQREEGSAAAEPVDDSISLAPSPTESLLRMLSFGPEEASAWSEPVVESPDHSALSSIVPTPTRGLSVRHFSHRVIRRSEGGGESFGSGKAGSRMLPLDVESLNRRLLETAEEAAAGQNDPNGEEVLSNDQGNATASTSHEKSQPQEARMQSEQAPKGERPSMNKFDARKAPQEAGSSARVENDDHSYRAASHMREPGDASQGTFNGSVTLPTLNLPAPDSPSGSLWLPSNLEIRPSPEKRSPLRSLLSHASLAIVAQIGRVAAGIYDVYGPEKPVATDHVRVRWTCTCGKQLYDDFVERRRGAARELEAYLNRPRAHTSPSSPAHSTRSSFSEPNQIFSNNPSVSPSPATTWGSLSGDSSFPSNYSPTTLRSNNPFSVRVSTLPPARWLLTCADEGQFTTKLSHVDVTETKIRSDRDLAMAVRALYAHVNRAWWRVLRLRGLVSVDFVQFEVHRNRVVDVRKAPDMPPKGQGYDFEPHDLVPPVGRQYLLHLLAHPEDYDNEFITNLLNEFDTICI